MEYPISVLERILGETQYIDFDWPGPTVTLSGTGVVETQSN